MPVRHLYGKHQCRGKRRLNYRWGRQVQIQRRKALLLIDLNDLTVIIAAVFTFIFSLFLIFLGMHWAGSHVLFGMAGFRLVKNRDTLQLILAIMLIDHQSGSADEDQNCKNDMAETLKQMLRFWAKLQIINVWA